MKESELRRGIGYVIQHAGLFPHRTVLDNVATVPRLLGMDKTETRKRAMELLERVGLDPAFAKRYPAQLSGGQQQRVGVARALAADPPVMLMDEPFSAVDPVVREQLQDEFLRLQGELGKTIVFVTHDIDEAIKLGDQVAVLRVGGHLAQLAAPAYLLAHPVDDFVADFVGRDRGYRALASRPRPRLPLRQEPHRRDRGERGGRRRVARDDWVLVVDDDEPPAGLGRAVRGVDGERPQPRCCTAAAPSPRRAGPLRAALDAALSSPSRRGVIVDDDGAPARHGHAPTRCSPPSRRPTGPRPRGARPAGGAGGMTWFLDHLGEVLRPGGPAHAYLAGVPLVVGLLLALPLGWLARRYPRLYAPLIAGSGLLYTIPSAGAVRPHAAAHPAPRSSTRSTSSSR